VGILNGRRMEMEGFAYETRNKFIAELHVLLKKYAAEIKAEDHWQGYAECGEDVRMTVEFNDWKIDEIDLGKWVNKEGHGGM
jgi:hypothetical protein